MATVKLEIKQENGLEEVEASTYYNPPVIALSGARIGSESSFTVQWDALHKVYTFIPKEGITITKLSNGRIKLSTTNSEDEKWVGEYRIYFKANDHNAFIGFYNLEMSGPCTSSNYTEDCKPLCQERWLPEEVYDGNFKIILRQQWGALPPKEGIDYPDIKSNDLSTYYHSIVIHHTGNANNTLSPKQLQLNEFANGYADIPYHFLVATDGRIYEGRPITKQQAHVKGNHEGLIGIALLADLDTQNGGVAWWKLPFETLTGNGDLTDPMLYSLLKLCKHLKLEYGINDLGGHKEYHALLNPNSNDGGDTRTCPGDLGMLGVNFVRRVLNLPTPK